MKTVLRSLAALGAFAVINAHAVVTASLGGGMTPFLALDPVGSCAAPGCTLGGSFATISGGSIYNASNSSAAEPVGTVGHFLAAGPDPGAPSIVTIAGGTPYLSFLWGSPDTYNTLIVTSTGGGTQTFTVADFGLPGDGNQGFSAYVQFQGVAGSLITGLEFESSQNAFETSNYSITPVPEPGTYALMLAGLSVLGWVARRRRG